MQKFYFSKNKIWKIEKKMLFLYSNFCLCLKFKNYSGCGAVRLAHLVWDQRVEGSNPFTPTKIGRKKLYLFFYLLYHLLKPYYNTTPQMASRIKINAAEIVNARTVLFPTPSAPPSVLKPTYTPIIAVTNPNKADFPRHIKSSIALK